MKDKSDRSAMVFRPYKGIIWIGDQPGIRLEMVAKSLADAVALVIETYGEGHIYSIWNEEDAARPR